jgi:cyclic pyranopterin phosphate synthase
MARQRRVHAKPLVHRRAKAVGEIRLRASTVRSIRRGKIDKGDPIAVGEIAGLGAMKRTSELIPHCHIVPLTGSRVELSVTSRGVRSTAVAEAIYRTGVEMEALVGVTVSLLTVWDMVKYLEKDARGGYPKTRIGPVRVVSKTKSSTPERA